MKEKAVITAAITGSIHTPTMSDYLPITPQQIADERESLRGRCRGLSRSCSQSRDGRARSRCKISWRRSLRVSKAAANSRLHHHGRRIGNDSGAAGRPGNPLQTGARLLQCRLHQTSPSSPSSPKYKEWKHEWEKQYLGMTEDFIFANTFKSMRSSAPSSTRWGPSPSLRIYDAGMVNNVAFMIQAGYIRNPSTSSLSWASSVASPPAGESHVPRGYAKKQIGDFEFFRLRGRTSPIPYLHPVPSDRRECPCRSGR